MKLNWSNGMFNEFKNQEIPDECIELDLSNNGLTIDRIIKN